MWDLNGLGREMAVRRDTLKFLAVGASAISLVAAAPPPAQLGSAAPASVASVAAFYDTWHSQPIWFKGGVNPAVVSQLTTILQRAPFDGFAPGPQLAAQVQAAAAQAASGKPVDVANAEQVLSSAWVQYVQAIRKPTPGMYYAYSVLAPQGTRADQILLTAAAAPSLEAYLSQTARVNPIYAQLRDTAWAEAQASGCPE